MVDTVELASLLTLKFHTMVSLTLEYPGRREPICQSFLANRDSTEKSTRLLT